MYHLRFPVFIALLSTPFFAFAQTATSTDPIADYQKQIEAIVQERAAQVPTAEDIRTGAIRDYLSVITAPSNPAPHETVRIKIESYLSDLNKATIVWSKNGSVVLRGIGKTEFSFANGNSGETTRINIRITTNAGEVVNKDLSFRPAGMTLLWEADTYVPPFYKGKPLMSTQARVRAIAVSDTTLLDAKDLSYVWKKDGEAVASMSGYGKNSFSFMGPKPYGKTDVSVLASSLSDSITSEIHLKEIPLSQPFILFYENHPLLGVWYNAPLGSNLSLTKKEFSITAAPYYFSNDSTDVPSFAYDWSLNGSPVTNTGTTITLRNDQNTKGDSLLAFAMRGLKQTFQSGNHSLLINFTADESVRAKF